MDEDRQGPRAGLDRKRPPFAIEPGPSQQSSWDYPETPVIEACQRRVRVYFNGTWVADSSRAFRVCERGLPPSYYIPRADALIDCLEPSETRAHCRWKGTASYYHLAVGDRRTEDAVWVYPQPLAEFAAIAGFLAYNPHRVDACYLDHERVAVREAEQSGGWVTGEVVGPFRGEPEAATAEQDQ